MAKRFVIWTLVIVGVSLLLRGSGVYSQAFDSGADLFRKMYLALVGGK